MALDMKELARRGAEARIAEIATELNALHRLLDSRRTRTSATAFVAPALRRRKPMTAAQKAAVSRRMKKYWASRRKAQAK